MAHHKSCIKRIKTAAEANARNRAWRSRMRTEIRKLREMSDTNTATEQYRKITSLLDRLVCKNVIKANNAANRKSRLAHFVATLG